MKSNDSTIDDLTAKQLDENGRSKYAVFLPALSTFYASFIGKQRHTNYTEPARIPAKFENGIEGLNWINPKEAYFPYHWALYSAGHATLDVNQFDAKEDMVRVRDPNSFILGDSGGYQIGKGKWAGNWTDPNCPKAQKKRSQVLTWMDTYMDRGMVLDVPTWLPRIPNASAATGIYTYQDTVDATHINNEYFMKHRTGKCKFLNVLQGETHSEADDWYEQMKKFCDPKKYSRPFEGWAMGGQNMCDVHLMLKRLVALKFDGLLEAGLHDWMHFLGTSRLEWATMLTDVQRAVRKHHNENFTISFDCASPFLATANGQIYHNVTTPDRAKWVYHMAGSVDNKKYAKDSRALRDALLQDKLFEEFLESPVSERLLIKDICIYKDGILKPNLPSDTKVDPLNPEHWIEMPDQNKIGKVGRTSWDSFSYALQMGHNVWTHIHAVQEANRQCEQGKYPGMLVASMSDKKSFRQYDRSFFKDIVDDIFATGSRGKAEQLLEHYERYWMSIIGTRGFTGKRAVNSITNFHKLFTVDESEPEPVLDENGFDPAKLEELEEP